MELIVRRGGTEQTVSIERSEREPGRFKVTVEDRSYDVDLASLGGAARSLVVGGRQHEVAVRSRGQGTYEVVTAEGLEELEVLDLLTHLAEKTHGAAAGGGLDRVTAYMPGRVVAHLVEAGEEVTAGQGILVLEAMKMENEIRAERDGTVQELFAAPGEAVEAGDPLYEIE